MAGNVSEWNWIRRTLRPFAGKQLSSTLCLLGATLLSLVDPLILKWLIDHGLAERRLTPIVGLIALFILVYLLRIVLLLVGTLVVSQTILQVLIQLRLRLFRKLQSLDAAFYDRSPIGDLVERLEQDVALAGELGREFAPTFLRILLSITITVGIMVWIDAQLSCIVLPFLPLFLVLRAHFRSVLERAADEARQSVGDRASFLTECLNGAVQAQLLSIERTLIRKYAGFVVRTARTAFRQTRMEVFYMMASLGALALVTGAVLGAGAWQVARGQLSLGGYVAFYSYLMRLFDPLAIAVETYSRLKRAGGSIRRIAELETLQPSVTDHAEACTMPANDVQEIACQDVSFGYSGHPTLLHNINLGLRRGEKLAIVGRSGSGKSTVAKLLARLYETRSGSILLNNTEIRLLRLRSLRDSIAIVPQYPFLLRGTIRENALLGNRGVNEEELQRLTQIACFDSVVKKFAAGWEQILGPGGAGLSDGEKQRLAILRALLHSRPILVLDEATSALDPALEEKLLAQLSEHVRDRAVLLISHRLSTVNWADSILVLRDGQFVLRCSPADLAQDLEQAQAHLWGSQTREEPGAASQLQDCGPCNHREKTHAADVLSTSSVSPEH